jgi:hypothetical protein
LIFQNPDNMKTLFTLSLILLFSITAQSQVQQANMPIVKGIINSIVRYENTVFLGGEFDSVGGQYKPKLAAFDAITGAVLPWDPQPNGNVNKLIIANGKLVVAGNFNNILFSGIGKIAVFDLSNLILFNYNISNFTCKDLYWDGNLFVYYTHSQNSGSIRRFYIQNGIPDTNWIINLNSVIIKSISGSQDHIYIGGYDLAFNLPPYDHSLLRANISDGLIDTTFLFDITGSNANVWQVLYYNNKVYIAGWFNSINSIPRSGLAEIDPLTGNVTPLIFYTNFSQYFAIFPQGNTLWVSSVGISSQRIKQVDLNTGFVTCWTTNAMSGYSAVRNVWVTNDTVYAAGWENVGSQGSFKIFNGNDSWTTLGPDTLICPGNTYTINADPAFVSYLWNTGSTTSSITVNAAGNYWVTGTRANNCKATDTINVEFCTSINNQTTDNIFNLNLFPNPVESEFAVSFYNKENTGLKIELYNSLGQSVVEKYHHNLVIGLNEITLTTKDLLPGIYFLKITNDSMGLTRKIIKL